MQKVIAIATGWDGTQVREPGDVFEMPDSCFDPVVVDEDGKPTGQTRAKPGWFAKAVPQKVIEEKMVPEASDKRGKKQHGADDLT